jgi:hypothetical protein
MLAHRLILVRAAIAIAAALTFTPPAVGGPDDIRPLAADETLVSLSRGLFLDLGISFEALGTTTLDQTADQISILLPITNGIIDLATLDVRAEHAGTGLRLSNGIVDVEIRDFVLDDFSGMLAPEFCYPGNFDRRLTICGNLENVLINQFGATPEDVIGVVVGHAGLRLDGEPAPGQIPEPGTWGLLTVGLGGLLLMHRAGVSRMLRSKLRV